MNLRKFVKLCVLASFVFSAACQPKSNPQSSTVAPASLRDVPALKLNFRFETDVPAPTISNKPAQTDERNTAVQSDFDQNRAQEIVDKTITSPNNQRVLAVYHRADDSNGDFRLDMYSADGKLLRKITYNGMAVRYPDTIVWSPDSTNVAFMSTIRLGPSAAPTSQPTPLAAPNADVNENPEANANLENVNSAPATTATVPVEEPKSVLTFRTEQIYITNAEGTEVKPLTQNEGLIYFYFVWAPDGSALAALAATYREWRYLQDQAELRLEGFTPLGRPRLVEKNGRERRLDDGLTSVHPAWSPDSAKVAVAFDKQVRIYDAIGDAPTQAAIPLRNQLLLSSKTYDEDLQRKEQAGNSSANVNAQPNSNVSSNVNTAANLPAGTLPDENTLVSFNPVINLEWTEDKMLYLQTGYIKLMKNEADSARSYLRWHRLLFSPQPVALSN